MHCFKQFSLLALTAFGIFNSADCHLSKDAARCLISELFNISQAKPGDKVKVLEEGMEVCFVLDDHNDRTERGSLYQMILGDQKINFQICKLSVLMTGIGGSKWKNKYKPIIVKCFDDAFDSIVDEIEFRSQPFNESDTHNFVLVSAILDQMIQSIEATIEYFGVFFDRQTQIPLIIKFLEERRKTMLDNSNNLLELGFVSERPKTTKKHSRHKEFFRIDKKRGGKRHKKTRTPKQLLFGTKLSGDLKRLNKVKNFQVAIHAKSHTFSS